jgi:hypothetical protein
VPALEESVHFHVRSSALSFDRFANDYAVSKQFAPEPCCVGSLLNPSSQHRLPPTLELKRGGAEGLRSLAEKNLSWELKRQVKARWMRRQSLLRIWMKFVNKPYGRFCHQLSTVTPNNGMYFGCASLLE